MFKVSKLKKITGIKKKFLQSKSSKTTYKANKKVTTPIKIRVNILKKVDLIFYNNLIKVNIQFRTIRVFY